MINVWIFSKFFISPPAPPFFFVESAHDLFFAIFIGIKNKEQDETPS